MKKMLFIYNPNAGTGVLKPKLADVIDILVKGGYDVTTYPTQCYHDALAKTVTYTEKYDIIVCSGGDGTLDEVVNWLLTLGYIPSFCTACYREGRTGDRFMKLLKSGQIVNCCQPNALMTLKEYLEDYASEDTKKKGEEVIRKELEVITNPVVREKAAQYIENIHEGKRDFRF